MIAVEITTWPFFRSTMRKSYFKYAVVNVSPTEKGKLDIDIHHPLYVSNEFLLLFV